MGCRPLPSLCLVVAVSLVGCYHTPQHKRAKAHPSYLSEAEAERMIQKGLARYGIKFISNMRLKRERIEFVADGYDRDLRVGYEYRSHEGRDFEDESGGNSDGLTDSEIEMLRTRQVAFREFFLIVPEGTGESVTAAVDKFVNNLYTWEVLKRARARKADNLFPEKSGKRADLLPWEATGDLKKKRLQMERKERDHKTTGEQLGQRQELDEGQAADETAADESRRSDERVTVPQKASDVDDVWQDEEEDF